VADASQEEAIEMLLNAFAKWFGGASAMPSLGTWRMRDGSGVEIDRGQTVIASMTTRREFRKRRAAIRHIARRVGDLLNQEAMAVIAYPASEGFVVGAEP
jgi:hypothetical protein